MADKPETTAEAENYYPEDSLPEEDRERFEGREVIFRSSHLKASDLVGPMAVSKLEPGMRVRCRVDAVVIDVNHKTVKQVPDCLERIHVLAPLEDAALIVEEL